MFNSTILAVAFNSFYSFHYWQLCILVVVSQLFFENNVVEYITASFIKYMSSIGAVRQTGEATEKSWYHTFSIILVNSR